jgi:hypothetical protein
MSTVGGWGFVAGRLLGSSNRMGYHAENFSRWGEFEIKRTEKEK